MMGQRSKKRFYFYLLVISVVLSAVITFIIKNNVTPFNLEVIQEQYLDDIHQSSITYHDFDNDGISETIATLNEYKTSHYRVHVLDNAGEYIDQLNYAEPVNFSIDQKNILFADYNGDNMDDVFTITQAEDSIFLYLHDLSLKRVIINRQFLLTSHSPYSKRNTKMQVNAMKLIKVGSKDKKLLLFAVTSNSTIQPRGVYLFDIEKRKIIRRFESDAYVKNVLIYDLNGDGKDEIILTSNAVGNIHYKSEYTDQKCWLFIMNTNLNPIYKPLSFGEYRNQLYCEPVEIQSERFLLLTQRFFGNQNVSDEIFFVNGRGNILPEKKIKLDPRLPFIKPLLIEKKYNNSLIFTWQGMDKIISLDKKLNIVNQVQTGFNNIAPYAIRDLDNDNANELICLADNNLVVLSDKLKLLASTPLQFVDALSFISFRENGMNKPADIGINIADKFLLYSFRHNFIYTSLPYIAIAMALLIFVAMSVLYLMLSRIYIFSKYHRFSLANSNEAAIMLNYFGEIKNYNEKAKTIFDLNQDSKGNNYFKYKLGRFPQLVELIERSINSNSAVSKWLSMPTENTLIEGEVHISPIVSKFKFLCSYLVEFRDLNESIVTKKLTIWSKAAQKMIHDIKYPLSVVAVKLDTFKMRLSKLTGTENAEIQKDIDVINNEIKRVNVITKSFLKFSDLEKPNFQAVSVKKIVNSCVKRYDGFINENLKIKIYVDNDVEDIWADEQQIELLFHNLLENSIDALKGEGLITISATLAQYLDNGLSRMVEFEIADTGPGIDQEIRERIFQPYITTKTDGTGVGLSIAKKIIEDHQGQIGFYSKENFGTVVRFSIKVPQV